MRVLLESVGGRFLPDLMLVAVLARDAAQTGGYALQRQCLV